MPAPAPDEAVPPGVDTTIAHSARVWNYWLGGKDNYPVDRALGDGVIEAYPQIVMGARADRAFLRRSVAHLARAEGVRQFLDIGTGLPTHDNTHEVAQSVAQESRVVYVDNDPIVLAHARGPRTPRPRRGLRRSPAARTRRSRLRRRRRTVLRRGPQTLTHRPAPGRHLGLTGIPAPALRRACSDQAQ